MGVDYKERLFNDVSGLPLIDYHCHLDPKEIYEDRVFNDLGEIWLKCDHYKWRLMRAVGIDEDYITGNKPYFEKFLQFVKASEMSVNNPVPIWAEMELKKYFDIEMPFNSKNAETIWNKANSIIKSKQLSPRKLIAMSNIEYIATTDDPVDSLLYHKRLSEDKSFKVIIAPSFRVDKMLLFKENGYLDYIDKLSKVSNIGIKDLNSFKAAVIKRLEFFKTYGCKFSDVGISDFPKTVLSDNDAEIIFKKVLNNEKLNDTEYDGLLGNLFVFLGNAYKKYDIVMQLHLAVMRNVNKKMFLKCGRDSGFDIVGDVIEIKHIVNIFNEIDGSGGLPETIVYTLNPEMYYPLITAINSFRGVHLGISWWFNDHKRGIMEVFRKVSELSSISSIIGMLTDSRSFLSYVRHDYYRMILAEFLAGFIKSEKDYQRVLNIMKALSYDNAKRLIG